MPDPRESHIAAGRLTASCTGPAELRCIAQNLALRDPSDHAKINIASEVQDSPTPSYDDNVGAATNSKRNRD
jgi:hypothetical protein